MWRIGKVIAIKIKTFKSQNQFVVLRLKRYLLTRITALKLRFV